MRRDNTSDYGAEGAEMQESLGAKIWHEMNKPRHLFPGAVRDEVTRLECCLKEKEDTIRRLVKELDQVKLERDDQKAKAEESASRSARLEVENQSLSTQNSDLRKQIHNLGVNVKQARWLENSSEELLDWIQSVIGYAGNKNLFLSDADELLQFRADAKRLPSLLRSNGIECDSTPSDKGRGFLHIRDARVMDGAAVVSAPMLLRNEPEGKRIIAEGIILVPDVAEKQQQEQCDEKEAKQKMMQTEASLALSRDTESDQKHLPTENSLSNGVLVDREPDKGSIPPCALSTAGLPKESLPEPTIQSRSDNSSAQPSAENSSVSWDID